MAIVVALIPSGFSKETKKRFIEETKKAICTAFNFESLAISVFVQEFCPENMCEHAAKKRVLIIYTTKGKSEEQKNLAGVLFEKACADVLGPDKGDTFIIFKEHDLSNLCVRGILKSMDPIPVSFVKKSI